MVHSKKRGQLAGNFAVWIFGIIVVALILLLGFKLIGSQKENADATRVEKFKKDIREDINSLATDFGSKNLKEYTVPNGFDYLCLYDKAAINEALELNQNHIELNVDNPLLKDMIKSNSAMNAFIMINEEMHTFEAENLKMVFPYAECIQAEDNTLKYAIKGKGDSTLTVSIPSQEFCQNAQNMEERCSPLYVYADYDDILIELCKTQHNICE